MTAWLSGYTPTLWCVQKLLKYLHNGQDELILNHILEYGDAIWKSLSDAVRYRDIPENALETMPYVVWSSLVRMNSRNAVLNSLPIPMNTANVTRFFQEDYSSLQTFAQKHAFTFINDHLPVDDTSEAAWNLFCRLPAHEQQQFATTFAEGVVFGCLAAEVNQKTNENAAQFVDLLSRSQIESFVRIAYLIKHSPTERVEVLLPTVFKLHEHLILFFVSLLHERPANDFPGPVEWMEALYATYSSKSEEMQRVRIPWNRGVKVEDLQRLLVNMETAAEARNVSAVA